MQQRTTSAGYRLPLQSRPRSSEFHKSCVPTGKRPVPQGTSNPGQSNEESHSGLDNVTQDKIWRQAVENEKKGAQQW